MNGEQALNEVRHLTGDGKIGSYLELNCACREYCQKSGFPWLREVQDGVFWFKAGVVTYVIEDAGFRRLDSLWVKGSSDGRWYPVDELTPVPFEDKVSEFRNDDGEDDPGKPEFFRLDGGAALTVTVTPTPDVEYEARIDGIAASPVITRRGELPGPADYHDAIVLLAAGYRMQNKSRALLLAEPAKEFELARAQQLEASGARLIAEANAKSDRAVRDGNQNRMSRLETPKIRLAR